MQCCWRQDPQERPTMAQVVEWSKLPELKSLRTILSLELKELLCVCQCHVNHVNRNVVEQKPLNFQSTLPLCESFTPLFSSLCAQSPQGKNAHISDCHTKDSDHQHVQIWVAHANTSTTKLIDSSAAKMTIITFRSCDLGYWVSTVLYSTYHIANS